MSVILYSYYHRWQSLPILFKPWSWRLRISMTSELNASRGMLNDYAIKPNKLFIVNNTCKKLWRLKVDKLLNLLYSSIFWQTRHWRIMNISIWVPLLCLSLNLYKCLAFLKLTVVPKILVGLTLSVLIPYR